MLQMLPKTRDIEVLAKGLVLTLTPVPADDDRYSNEMCPQPLELICADFSFLRPPLKPKRKRCRVKKRPPVPRCVLPAMPRPRERRSAAPHVTGGGRDGSGERDGGGGDGDGGGSDPPPAPPALAYDIAGRTL